MNPYALIAAGALAVGAFAGTFFYGVHIGKQGAEAQEARDERIAGIAYDAGQKGAAAEIAKIKPKNVTIRQELEREIQTNTVYSDCRVPADGVRLVNEALTGRAERAGDRELPRAGAAEARP
jgi:hypothetical protein